MFICRNTKEYREGVKKFVENATLNVENQGLMRCPCKKCQNLCHQNGETIVLHLLKDGWICLTLLGYGMGNS